MQVWAGWVYREEWVGGGNENKRIILLDTYVDNFRMIAAEPTPA
jgi:hypothetical protein